MLDGVEAEDGVGVALRHVGEDGGESFVDGCCGVGAEGVEEVVNEVLPVAVGECGGFGG